MCCHALIIDILSKRENEEITCVWTFSLPHHLSSSMNRAQTISISWSTSFAQLPVWPSCSIRVHLASLLQAVSNRPGKRRTPFLDVSYAVNATCSAFPVLI